MRNPCFQLRGCRSCRGAKYKHLSVPPQALGSRPLLSTSLPPYAHSYYFMRPKKSHSCSFLLRQLQCKEICHLLAVQKSTIYQALALYQQFGLPYNPLANKGGWPCILSQVDLKYINSMVKCCHCIYLDELQTELLEVCGTSVSLTTLYQALCYGITRMY